MCPVPPRDPRLCPDLERALPGDLKPGSTQVLDFPEPWSIQFGGEAKEWCNVSVGAWALDVRDREVIDVEWFTPDGLAWTESYVVEREKMERRW